MSSFTGVPGTIVASRLSLYASLASMSVSVGTIHWLEFDEGGAVTVDCGLFKCCFHSNCVDFDDLKGVTDEQLKPIHETTGLCFAAMACYVGALAVIGHLVCVQKLDVRSKSNGVVTLVLSVFGAVFAIASLGNYANNVDLSMVNSTYGFSMYLAAASGVLSIMAGILAFLGNNYMFRSRQAQNMGIQPPTYPYAAPIVQVHTSTSASTSSYAGAQPYNPHHYPGMMAPPPPPPPPPYGYAPKQPLMSAPGNQYPHYGAN